MNTSSSKKQRTNRVSPLKLPPGVFERGWDMLRRTDVMLRIVMCLAAAGIMWSITGAWFPTLGFRIDDVPRRNIVPRVEFPVIDVAATDLLRKNARENFEAIYRHDPSKLTQVTQALKAKVFQLRDAATYDSVKVIWQEFAPQTPIDNSMADTSDQLAKFLLNSTSPTLGIPVAPEIPLPSSALLRRSADFDRFRAELGDDAKLEEFSKALDRAMGEFYKHGLFKGPTHKVGTGSQTKIQVYMGTPGAFESHEISRVQIAQATPRLKTNLETAFKPEISIRLFNWLKERLPSTLTYEEEMTKSEAAKRADELPAQEITFTPDSVLADRGVSIDGTTLSLLKKEHKAYVEQLDGPTLTAFAFAKLGMYVAVYALCGFYFYFREPRLLNNLALTRILMLVVTTICVGWFAANTRFELVPLLLFSMIAVIIFKQEAALLLSACVVTLFIFSKGFGLSELVVNFASMSTAVLLIRHVRSRTKLIFVGCWTAVITFATTIGACAVAGDAVDYFLVQKAAWLSACCVGAGLLMTGLLPFIEKFFDVQTDLSLLELGDVAHPLLQELVRRAPGTYNHSINVASIAQAAAEAIGANGLLVRVGAYFHDIGKMLKPQYFIENQTGDNRHESLVPAMSTLVIIAHVKDGADLARQHNLPKVLIDFILQHHGTTLVEYFYHRANEQQKEQDPDAELIDEGNYRYPGPKPQTKEAAVLMLSDAVESAGRALVDPAPARIESLVEEIAMKRLLDGQFGECGLTLEELRIAQESITKSLTAVYHGRIKYPDQQTA